LCGVIVILSFIEATWKMAQTCCPTGLTQRVQAMTELRVSGLMNNTKWDELRLAMSQLGSLHPMWRTRDVSGYVSPWDGEWFYHFRAGGYESIEWAEIRITTRKQDIAVFDALKQIHLPGERIEGGFRIYGYVPDGTPVRYI
jgi:hypothetical protein